MNSEYAVIDGIDQHSFSIEDLETWFLTRIQHLPHLASRVTLRSPLGWSYGETGQN